VRVREKEEPRGEDFDPKEIRPDNASKNEVRET
jgi:hypothetical protein